MTVTDLQAYLMINQRFKGSVIDKMYPYNNAQLIFVLVFCKNGINQIQMPYLRATHQIDFLCLFLALWMELLGLISVSAALARTVSFSLDAMTGGLVRIYILGII